MAQQRKYAASVKINSHFMWVVGGEYTRRTEVLDMGTKTAIKGPLLPEVMLEHCAVKVNETHVFLGGNSFGLSK